MNIYYLQTNHFVTWADVLLDLLGNKAHPNFC
jgi:hypothetical protein